ncbi:hypothetical protein FRB94_014073 [Tulasnella sp. JGI-2019a]|nr:hypothetical protein FRB94_014073 [Tulasnella sp. JGI-2019a]
MNSESSYSPTAKRRWSSPMRREIGLVLGLFFLLILLFQSDFSFRYSSAVAGEWQYGYQPEQPVLYDAEGQRIPSPATPLATTSKSPAGMNDLTLRWTAGNPMPETTLLQHTWGFTVFDNLYAWNGTIYIVTSNATAFPELREMTSTGYAVFNGKEEVAKREPTDADMKVITVAEAHRLLGGVASRVDGVSFMVNDPPQFINHYYHFCAEFLVGMWRAYTSLDLGIKTSGTTKLPSPRRLIMTHTKEAEWRDYARMNQYVFHGAFPSASMEHQEDWKDRAETLKVWKFDRVVFTDRAAAMRTHKFTDVERYAAPSFDLPGSRNFWEPLRANVVEFAGANRTTGSGTMDTPVITYVSRQGWGRRMLKPEDHERLVNALRKLEKDYGWEVNVVLMDKLTREEQIRLCARTTVSLLSCLTCRVLPCIDVCHVGLRS